VTGDCTGKGSGAVHPTDDDGGTSLARLEDSLEGPGSPSRRRRESKGGDGQRQVPDEGLASKLTTSGVASFMAVRPTSKITLNRQCRSKYSYASPALIIISLSFGVEG